MSFLRSPAALRSLSRRSPFMIRPLSTSSTLRATGYGDMEGSPESKDPQNQGASSSAKQNAEHPGPAPPAEGKGTGKGPTKGGEGQGQKDPADASAQSGGSRSKEAKETGSSPTGGKVGGGGKRAFSTSARQWLSSKKEAEETVQKARESETSEPASQPKIISNGDPAEGQSQEKKKEVEQHNKEFEERYDRAQPATDNKVDEKFWKGQGTSGPSKESK